MNRGEGAKYAAKAKSGQIGIYLFKDTKPNKNKKFGYKKRAQTYSIRKVTTAQDSQANSTPAPLKKPTSEKATYPKSHTQYAKETGSPWSRQIASNNTSDRKLTGTDFVKRNVQKVGEKTKEDSKDAHTIALTQDQLNAILKSIGQIAGSEKVASIEIEDGDVKVNAPDEELPKDKFDDSNQDSKPDKKDGNEHTVEEGDENISPFPGSQNILSLVGKARTRTPSRGPSTEPTTPSKTSGAANAVSSKTLKERSAEKVAENGKKQTMKDPKTGDGNQTGSREEGIGQVEFAHLSLAERKRRKWKQEQDEQEALNRQQALQEKHVREVVASRMGMMHHEMSTPEHHERSLTASRNTPQVDTTTSLRDPFSLETSPRGVAPSSLGVIETQRIVPAAMRSSFLIGGQGSAGSRLNDHNAQVKRRQQQEWLKELEQQRIEAQERKEQEKRRHQEFESNLTHQWAEPVELPKTQQSIKGHGKVHDDSAMYRQIERKVDRGEEVEQPHSAPPPGSEGRDDSQAFTKPSQERSHIRAHNLLLDPAEIERREAQRVKHMEHMLAVKAQVEEKQRLKREAEERRRQGEAEEERQLAHQRMNLQHQYDSEKEKQRKKEDDEAARHTALVESMQAAYNDAQKEKHQKRLEKLTKMGHDTSNLRSSWDNQQDNSPPKQDTKVAYKTSPRPEQPTMPQHVQHPPEVPIPLHVMDHVINQVKDSPIMVDAFTSPVYDQAVQTDVTLQGGLLEREPSAHIEYRPHRRIAQQEAGRKDQKMERIQTYKAREKKRISKEERQSEVNARVMTQTQQTSRTTSPGSEPGNSRKKSVKKLEKPVWGANTKTKKLQQNSDKDLTVNKRKREERRQQRAAELLAEQERNAPGRLLKAKKPVAAGAVQPDTVQGSKPTQSRAGGSLDRKPNHKPHHGRTDLVQDQGDMQTWTDENSDLPDTPPLKNGDFVPFLRSDEPLMSEDSVPVTPESHQMLRQRKIVQTVIADDNNRGRKENKIRLLAQNEKDPLLNPDRLKDTEQRQERILQQLSHLRQGLMMKQREMELGLSSPV
ncbi:coiled-coil domain-containing protein 66-like isoform X2 [Patiria miniata]|uniref:CCDC66 domain-containing protein n=1 Tax=Patiria miniata TaxID=46514 RepID=A0A914BC95_PATMI|nr:coiled-coil domain-containing protein 66-like isoform X2 [Patiria miniata]